MNERSSQKHTDIAANRPAASSAPTSSTAAGEVDTIAQDIACPRCEYNLRGLHGSIVDCPECGHRCDVAQLISRQWTRPWWNAPKFNLVLMPASWLFVATLTGGCLWSVVLFNSPLTQLHEHALPALAIGAVVLLVWAVLMRTAWGVFRDVRGVLLPLLAHVLLVGIMIAVFGTIGVALTLLIHGVSGATHSSVGYVEYALTAAAIPVLIGIGWLSRRGERYIAQHCIRRYLDVHTTVD